PPELERDGLAGALRKEIEMLERIHGVKVELNANGGGAGPPDRDLGVLRIAHEAIHNALRHADASKITGRLHEEDDRLTLEAADGQQALTQAELQNPDVILMDLVMPRLDGVGAMRELRRRLPEIRVVALTSFLDDERLLPAIQAGAAGYLLKDAEPDEVTRAV